MLKPRANGSPLKISCNRASLVVQWLRVHVAKQRTPVQSLVWEDPTRGTAAKPASHNY